MVMARKQQLEIKEQESLPMVKNVLHPRDDSIVNYGDDGMSLDNDYNEHDHFSYAEVHPSEQSCHVVSYNGNISSSTGTISEDDTQDAVHGKELTAQELNEGWYTIQGKKDECTVKMTADPTSKSHTKKELDGEQTMQDGYVKNSTNRRLGKAVIHSEATNKKPVEIRKTQEGNGARQMVINTNAEHAEVECKDVLSGHEMRDDSAMGCLHSIGSDLTRTQELSEQKINVSMLAMEKDPSRTPISQQKQFVPLRILDTNLHGNKRDFTTITNAEAPIYNTVTWSLDGPAEEVQSRLEACIGHYRL